MTADNSGFERRQLLVGAGIAVTLGALLAVLLWVAQAFDLVRWRPPIEMAMSAPGNSGDFTLSPAQAAPGAVNADRAWFEGGDRLVNAPVSGWLAGTAGEQLAASAMFVFATRRDDDGYDLAGPGFMRDAAVLRYCLTGAAQVEGVNPDTPISDLAVFCVIALDSGADSQSQDATPTAVWRREGVGAMVLDKPVAVTRVRVEARYDGWAQNFTVVCGGALTVLEGLGTDERSVRYDGTHRMDCGEVEIQDATGVWWSLTEVR